MLTVEDLGKRPYGPVLELQEQYVEKRRGGEIGDTLLLVEHEPVYTLGRAAKEDNVLLSGEELGQRGIDVVRIGRGGDVTYHGPGQLVGYPIVDLGARGKGVLWYVQSLEQILVDVLAGFGVEATTDRKNRGVWVGNEKIAAIGVRVTRRITMHGFALNVRMDLGSYAGIVPCGITDKGVTSLHLLVPDVTMDTVKEKVVEGFEKVFWEDTGCREQDAGEEIEPQNRRTAEQGM